jgi:uncharacterized protein YndB with AHSA1/START domain
MSTQPIIVEKVVNAPVARVWKAITDHQQMKEWYFKMPAFEAKKGFEFTFEGGTKDQKFTHVCKITEVIENKKLSTVTWELTDMGGKTKVKLTHTGLETFPPIEAFARKNFEAGWNSIVGDLLPKYTEKRD